MRVLPPIHVHTPHTNLSPRVFIYLGRLLSRSGVGLKCLRYFRFSAIITEMSKKPGVMYARTDAAASSQSPVGAPSWRGPVTSRHVATNRANRARDLLTMCVSVVAVPSVRPSVRPAPAAGSPRATAEMASLLSVRPRQSARGRSTVTSTFACPKERKGRLIIHRIHRALGAY